MSDPLDELILRARREQPDFGTQAVLDVGANRGQSYQRFRLLFPDAPIHSFEPAPMMYQRLSQVMAGDPRATAVPQALGLRPGKARFASGHKTDNHLLAPGQDAPQEAGTIEIEIDVTTGDAYCAAQGIARIDFLKVDAEGFDLEVLAGFAETLRAGRILYLQVETTTTLDNRFHVHLERFIHFLHPYNYRLTDLSEPHRRIHKTNQRMRGIWFCNALFALEVEAPTLRRDGMN